MQPGISAVILTKNDEEIIARCLEAVSWVDEIIVVDDGSSDRTVEICKGHGAKVFIHSMGKDGFAGQKNLGIDSASGDWVLQLDSDEVVTGKLKDGIIKAVGAPGDMIAFRFAWEVFFLGRLLKSETNEIHVRLFKKGKARFTGRIHEAIEVDGRIGSIEGKIQHYCYRSISHFIRKNDLYTAMEAESILEKEGILSTGRIRHNLTFKVLRHFLKLYVRNRAYQDGTHGLVWCILHTMRKVMIWAKYWELVKDNLADKG